jgi:hypothetical protein
MVLTCRHEPVWGFVLITTEVEQRSSNTRKWSGSGRPHLEPAVGVDTGHLHSLSLSDMHHANRCCAVCKQSN